MRRSVRGFLVAMAVAMLAAGPPASAGQDRLTVFAAASLTDAFSRLGEMYRERSGTEVVFSFASSSTLAQQIENGAPADIYASADVPWMDYLAERGLIVADSLATPIGNGLVLIAAADRDVTLAVAPGFPLARALGDGRLAVGDPDHVPAGRYARQALESLGVWDEVEPKLARASSVRSALALVERGEAPLGIVYATDAAIVDGVRIVGRFPAGSHDPIRYPMTIVAGHDSAQARAFLDFVSGAEAGEVFADYGFLPD